MPTPPPPLLARAHLTRCIRSLPAQPAAAPAPAPAAAAALPRAFELPPPFADPPLEDEDFALPCAAAANASADALLNASLLYNSSNCTTTSLNGTALLFIDGASFFTRDSGVNTSALRAALASASASRGGAPLRVLDIEIATTLQLNGLTADAAARVAFDPALAASAAAAFLASSLGVAPARVTASSEDAHFNDDNNSWRVAIVVRGFGGRVAAVSAAAATLAEPATAVALSSALAPLLCGAPDSAGAEDTCVRVDAALAPLSVRAAVAAAGEGQHVAAGNPAPPSPPLPSAPAYPSAFAHPELYAFLGVVVSGFGAQTRAQRACHNPALLRSRLALIG